MAKHPMRTAAERAEAKERLERAAPDLLAALKLARKILQLPRIPRADDWRAINGAIAKAEPPESNQQRKGAT